ncbi:MAG: amidohydrolase family protein [Chloroflexota bacterium]|nr:amidohydrolase family protein [Chloroflexota bacterium]
MHRILSLVLLTLVSACATSQRPITADLAFVQVNVVDVERGRVLPEQTVLIAGSRIQAVGPSAKVRVLPGVLVVDGRGKYLIPGLTDTHTHLGWDLDSLRAPESTSRELLLQVANGVTTIREASTRGQEGQQLAARSAPERLGTPMPRIYVSGRIDPQNVVRYGAADARDLTQRLITLGADGIKIRNGLTIADVQAVVEEAHAADRPVFGHTYAYPREAVQAGIDGVVHVDGLLLLSPNGHPDPAPADSTDWAAQWMYAITGWLHRDRAATDSLLHSMVERGVWLEPTLVVQDWIANPEYYRDHPSSRYRVGTYDEAREGFPTPAGEIAERLRESVAEMGHLIRRFHQLGGTVITGTDGTPLPGFGLHDELQLLVRSGLPPAAALQASTINAARALHWEARIGTIRPGKMADLVLLDANPLEDIRNTQTIRAVVLDGRYLDRQALDDLLAEAERAVTGTH